MACVSTFFACHASQRAVFHIYLKKPLTASAGNGARNRCPAGDTALGRTVSGARRHASRQVQSSAQSLCY